MIEIFAIHRLISDYLWEYKVVGAVGVPIFFIAGLLFFLFSGKRFQIVSTDLLFIFFLISVSVSEIITPAASSAVDLMKFIAYFIIYIAGRIGPVRLYRPAYLGIVCFVALLVFSMAALMDIGYQYWGSVVTFSGGYFFKTDMAISILILLSIIASTLASRFLLIIATLLAIYVIFKTNARIAFPLTIAIPAFSVFMRSGYIQKFNAKAIACFGLVAAVGMGLFLLIDFRALGLLGFDFADAFSPANTQGRSVIWAALWEAYAQADPLRKLIGSGLGADAAATAMFSESLQLEGVRAHSSYLYLLVCTGIIGSIVLSAFFYSACRRVSVLLISGGRDSVIISSLFVTLMLVFLWVSITAEIIIRSQVMVLVFYLSGVVVQRNLILKKMMGPRRVENLTRS